MEPEERFARIEALLHAMAERENQMEIRFNRRMDRADARMDRAEERMDRAEERMKVFDKRLEATRKLVQAGMKIVVQNGIHIKAMSADIREMKKTQQAFIDSLRRSGNGFKRSA